MKEKKILLTSIEEAKRFVTEASRCDFDVDVFYNRFTIDAKSILGVLSLDLARVLTVQMNGENEEKYYFGKQIAGRLSFVKMIEGEAGLRKVYTRIEKSTGGRIVIKDKINNL